VFLFADGMSQNVIDDAEAAALPHLSHTHVGVWAAIQADGMTAFSATLSCRNST
jgi:hypothetical protein